MYLSIHFRSHSRQDALTFDLGTSISSCSELIIIVVSFGRQICDIVDVFVFFFLMNEWEWASTVYAVSVPGFGNASTIYVHSTSQYPILQHNNLHGCVYISIKYRRIDFPLVHSTHQFLSLSSQHFYDHSISFLISIQYAFGWRRELTRSYFKFKFYVSCRTQDTFLCQLTLHHGLLNGNKKEEKSMRLICGIDASHNSKQELKNRKKKY